MKYVIQKNVFKEENYDKIFDALNRLGLEYEVVDCRPFEEHLTIDDSKFETDRKDIFVFGSVKMARVAAQYGWNPGSFYGGNHDFSIYKHVYRENLLNYFSTIQKFSEPVEWHPYTFSQVQFIRPCADSKAFSGKLYTKTKWEDFVEYSNKNGHIGPLNDNTLIQIADPVQILKEARIWVVGGKIVTSSYYFMNGNLNYEENVEPEGIEFAERMIEIYQPAECFVMDICLVPTPINWGTNPHTWKIVEINCINCSGFYKGDLQKILIALEDKYNPIETNAC